MGMRNTLFLVLFLTLASLPAQTSKLNTGLLLQQDRERSLQVFVKSKQAAFSQLSETYNFQYLYSAGDLHRITCSVKSLETMATAGVISYAEYRPSTIQVLNDTMRKRNRINAVHAGELPLSQAYDGSGTIYGMIDTGIDFNHPDFKDAQGNTRILYLWDQAVTNNSAAPQPYNYGREWTANDINLNLCTHTDVTYYGHGTHVAGIAAGNGLGSGKHKGVAPKANIIAVALNFNSTTSLIGDGVNYIFSKALSLGKPCVINISVGDYYGSHDGTDLETIAMEYEIVSLPGRAVVAAAGNAGSIRYHTKTQVQPGDTLFTWLKANPAIINYWFYADTLQAKNLVISIGANRSNYSNLGRTAFRNYNYAMNLVQTDTLKNNGNRIGIIRTSGAVNPSGVYEYAVEITADTTNLNWRVITAGQGLHHAWNFSFVGNNLPSTNQVPAMVNYIAPDSLYSMVSGFQCSDEVITVANYQNTRYYLDVQDSLRDNAEIAGSISAGSSLGPTRDGRQKPDIAASGQIIFSAGVMSTLPYMIANQPKDVSQDSLHVIGGGTSAASPIVAGIGNLYFQKFPTKNSTDFKAALTDCAYQDNFTGTVLPNYQWGYGKADGKNTLMCKENLVGVNNNELLQLSVAPNPFSKSLKISNPNKDFFSYKLFNSNGQLVLSGESKEQITEVNTRLAAPSIGIYFLYLSSAKKAIVVKLVKSE
jgi:subtilisin family serine protease